MAVHGDSKFTDDQKQAYTKQSWSFCREEYVEYCSAMKMLRNAWFPPEFNVKPDAVFTTDDMDQDWFLVYNNTAPWWVMKLAWFMSEAFVYGNIKHASKDTIPAKVFQFYDGQSLSTESVGAVHNNIQVRAKKSHITTAQTIGILNVK
jgi:hypothetical protein